MNDQSADPRLRPVTTERYESVPVGIVMRRQPGVTRWQRWVWRAVAVLPGAGPADWREIRRETGEDGREVVEYHAASLPVTLWRKETEAYRVALSSDPPSLYVVLRPNEGQGPDGFPLIPFAATASPFEAQDYADTSEEQVEPIAMPPALIGWVSSFVERHHVEEAFRKRRRDRVRVERKEDGRGDARVRQAADIYRSPASRRAAGKGGPDGETTH